MTERNIADRSIGIRSLAAYVPPGRMSAAELAAKTNGLWTEEAVRKKLGINQIAVPGPEDGVQEMGTRASLECIKRADLDPLEIDAIICIGDELREYPMTTSGIYIQERIGAKNAWAVDVMQKCSSFSAGVRLARSLLRSEPKIKTILIAGGYRNGDLIDYTNPRVSFMYNLAPGGGAVILQRGCTKNRILGTSLRSDGSLARLVVARYGGTSAPITPENVEEAQRCLDVVDQQEMRRILGERSHQNFLGVIHDSLEEAELASSSIDYLAILHMKRSGHKAILDDLSLREDQSLYLADWGHIGQFDQILSLQEGENLGRVRPGDLVVCVGAGIGYSWGATAIRWGEA